MRKKGGEEKKAMVALLVFLSWLLWRQLSAEKKTVGRTDGLFGGNVIKNPARYIIIQIPTCRNMP